MQQVKINRQKLDEIVNLVLRKNKDYGDAWQCFGPFTALVNIQHKLLRVESLSDGRPALVLDEGLSDTLCDLIGYSLLTLAWLEENERVDISD